jgi:hypothetical protein
VGLIDYELMGAVEEDLAAQGITPGVDFDVNEWRATRRTEGDDGFSINLGGIAHELVKSYGLRRDHQTGQWSFSLENIGKSFKEDPIWTTLDYLLLAVPVAKVGQAAAKITKGTSAAGRALEVKRASMAGVRTAEGMERAAAAERAFAGATAGRRARLAAQAAKALGKTDETENFAKAVQMEMTHGVPRTRASRFFASSAARRATVQTFDSQTKTYRRALDPEWENLVKAGGGADPFEQRVLYDVFAREARVEKEMFERMGEETIRLQNTVLGRDPEVLAKFHGFLERGGENQIAEITAAMGKEAGILAERTQNLKLRVHVKAHELGLLSDEVFEKGLKDYWPRVWKNMEGMRDVRAAAKARGAVAGAQGTRAFGVAGREAGERFRKARTLTEEQAQILHEMDVPWEKALDPTAGIAKLIESGAYVAQQGLLQKLAASPLMRTGDKLIEDVYALTKLSGDAQEDAAKALFAKAWSPEALAIVKGAVETAAAKGEKLAESEIYDLATRTLGWRRMDEAYKSAAIPGYLKRIPDDLKGRYLDPALAADMAGLGKITDMLPGLVKEFYLGSMGWFKASKTAYNPATHMRNIMGALVFHHFTVGGMGALGTKAFGRGRAALAHAANVDDVQKLTRGSSQSAEAARDWQEFVESGLAGSSFDTEIVRTIERAMGKINPTRVTALDWIKHIPGLGSSKLGDKALDMASWAERKYRYIDELAKADAFIMRRDYHLKVLGKDANWAAKGKDAMRMEARGRAYTDVVKYQPVFHQNSPFTGMVRDVIPFSSFTTEAVRVWKNAMIDKPHIAFAWTHMAEAMTQLTGGIMGFDEQTIEDAQNSMAGYNQTKKMLLAGRTGDGKPMFLDLSYIIPMGNIAEAGDVESNFFDRIQMDPFSSNPFFSIAYALKTGKDPFSGRDIEPRLMERELGLDWIPARGPGRRALGMVEHAVGVATPPLVPPGYAGMNLYEWARGEQHPVSGEALEDGILRTVGANVFGIRMYESDTQQQLLNAKREDRVIQEELGVQWNRYKWAHVNGRSELMESSLAEIRALQRRAGKDETGVEKYIAQGIKRREPGKWRGISTKKMQETLRRSRGLHHSPEDLRMQSELVARLQERTARTKAGRQYLESRGVKVEKGKVVR